MERTWISALILGAGQARRMGEAKQLLPFGETTLLGRVVENVLASQVQETVLILGHKAGAILRALGLNHPDPEGGLTHTDKNGFKVRINPGYREGLSSSIRLGVSSLDPRAGAVMILLGDQPLIDPPVIDSLIAAFRASDRGIVAPLYRGRRGHPILLDLKHGESMLRLRGDVGCREILSACPEDLLEVEVDWPGVVQDVDTLEEYRRCRESLAKGWAGRALMQESGLIRALGVQAGEMVCLVGGGGKTSLMFWLGRELAERYGRAIMTTTTRILEPNPSQTPCLLVSSEEEVRTSIPPLLAEHGRMTLAARRLSGGKLQGFPPEVIERLVLALPGVSWVIEADGSRQKPLKAPNATEPVIPPSTSLVVAMVGLDVLEGRLSEEYVFRPEIAAKLLGASLGDPVAPEHVVGLLAHPEGILKGTPPGARTIAFLNKADLPNGREKGELLARSILLRPPPPVKRVLLGSAAKGATFGISIFEGPGIRESSFY